MEIKLTHPFLRNSHFIGDKIGVVELLKGTNKLSTFCSKLEKQSIIDIDLRDPDKYKGDGFELFVEAFIKLNSTNKIVGINNYIPIECSGNIDLGVDGFGTGIDDKAATVQVKYKSNHMIFLTANEDHLTNFTWISISDYNVDPQTRSNMLIVTTGKGLNHFTDNEMFKNKVRCIGYDMIKQMVDNNLPFWNEFRNLVNESIICN